MSRPYFRLGTTDGLKRIVLEKPVKLPKMKKEKMPCDNCGQLVDKFQDSKEYKWGWCKNCLKVISTRKVL